jgi:hypothetical protein
MRRLCDWRLLFQALVCVVAVRGALAVADFRRVSRAFDGSGRRRSRGYPVDRIAWAVVAAGRVVPRATCLVKAIAARALLRRSGWPAVVWVGVSNDARNGFRAHAWVESDGRVVLGANPGGEFTRLVQLG